MKHVRLAMTVAVTVAIMLPAGIFAECCCSESKAGCCAVSASVKTRSSSCCSCEQTLAKVKCFPESSSPKVGNRVRPSCDCCCGVQQISTALPVRSTKSGIGFQSSWINQSPVDASLQHVLLKCIECALPALSHNKRQAILCVWIQ